MGFIRWSCRRRLNHRHHHHHRHHLRKMESFAATLVVIYANEKLWSENSTVQVFDDCYNCDCIVHKYDVFTVQLIFQKDNFSKKTRNSDWPRRGIPRSAEWPQCIVQPDASDCPVSFSDQSLHDHSLPALMKHTLQMLSCTKREQYYDRFCANWNWKYLLRDYVYITEPKTVEALVTFLQFHYYFKHSLYHIHRRFIGV